MQRSIIPKNLRRVIYLWERIQTIEYYLFLDASFLALEAFTRLSSQKVKRPGWTKAVFSGF
jgi:hypothetical protein